ncbi:MAG TPA: acyl-CoA dehydrogenase family protein [Isosphaeraceae bacterium]|jgi:alkylation response protein AidB-like acyl-CoA dehydrogenase|nr:acyl-CoA dehydrogenase family protein [Isosphaeraceae bacterium]
MATHIQEQEPETQARGATAEPPEAEAQTFVEAALKLGGKSEEEARRTGSLDRADDQVEALFAKKYQTAGSPVHRAVWERETPIELFLPEPAPAPSAFERVKDASLEVVRRHRAAGTLLDERGKISNEVFGELARAGYWGLLVDPEYGGTGAPFAAFAPFLTRMATIDPTVAGLASVHGCIGAVDPLRTFGDAEQKARYLPKLASGEKLSGFALTEPGAGSDLTALRTRAVLDGDDYVVNGEKLFITNAIPGRTVGLVCLIDDKPAVLIADLPEHEDEHFQVVKYGLYALRHSYNNGLRFRDFRVPRANLLRVARGDGLTIAYHGLNLGRVALCATAAGTMRTMLANILPWARFRRTYGAPIATRELVRRRVARLASLIVGADALVAWCSWLLDQGYRGEMECIVAKIFGSEAQKEAAIELFMKTHGGRAFLHGHMFGDNVHEFLAPCIYEGEGEILGLGFFKSLIKEHGKTYFEPIGRALHDLGIKKPNPMDPRQAWALRKVAVPYAKWYLGERLAGHSRPNLPEMPEALAAHAAYAAEALHKGRLEISDVMRKHQLKLADRQCRMAELSARIQGLVVMLATSLWAGRQKDELVQAAADLLCQDIARGLHGKRPSDAYFRASTRLGEAIADGGFRAIAGLAAEDILMPYEN